MNASLIKILQERERILARVGQQRVGIASSIAALSAPLSLVDRAIGIARYMRAHPAAVGIVVAILVALRTRSVLGMLARGIGIWRVFRQVRLLARRFGV